MVLFKKKNLKKRKSVLSIINRSIFDFRTQLRPVRHGLSVALHHGQLRPVELRRVRNFVDVPLALRRKDKPPGHVRPDSPHVHRARNV